MAEFQALQRQFTAYLRNPEHTPAPGGMEERRLKIYRELFYNNIEGFLANAFPVLRQLTADAHWHSMVRDFFARHQSQDPLFHALAEEFLHYLEDERGSVAGDAPFLQELAHYEWVELALSIAEDELSPVLAGTDTVSCVSKGVREVPDRPAPAPASLRSGTVSLADPNGDLLEGAPLISPVAWALAYDYPVHRIGPDFQPTAPGDAPTYLIVYRTRQDDVKFTEINAVTARLMALIEADPLATGRAHLHQIAAELGADAEAIVTAGHAMLLGLRARDVVLGTRRS